MTGLFRNVKTGHEWHETPGTGVRGFLVAKGQYLYFHTIAPEGQEKVYRVSHYDFAVKVLAEDAVVTSFVKKRRRIYVIAPKKDGLRRQTPVKGKRFLVMRYCGSSGMASFRDYFYRPRPRYFRRCKKSRWDFRDYDFRYNRIPIEIIDDSVALFDPKNFEGESNLDYTSASMCHTKVAEGVYDSTYDESRMVKTTLGGRGAVKEGKT